MMVDAEETWRKLREDKMNDSEEENYLSNTESEDESSMETEAEEEEEDQEEQR